MIKELCEVASDETIDVIYDTDKDYAEYDGELNVFRINGSELTEDDISSWMITVVIQLDDGYMFEKQIQINIVGPEVEPIPVSIPWQPTKPEEKFMLVPEFEGQVIFKR